MKKYLLILAVLLGTVSKMEAQVVFSENFNSGNIPATFTLYNVDGFTPDPTVLSDGFSFGTAAWIAQNQNTGATITDTAAYANSWYTPTGQANDWMVTPAITIPSTGVTNLKWRGKSYGSSTYLEEYEVRISTTNTQSGVAAGTVLLSVTNEPGTWTNHTISLAAYAGQTVYISFRDISNDNYILGIDDIVVAATSDDLSVSGGNPSEYTSIPVSQATTPLTTTATVTNVGGNTATNVSVNLVVTNLTTNAVVSTQTLTGPASLAGNATATVTGTTITPPTAAAVYEFRYIVSMTQTDANHANDTAYRYVIFDNNLYARDNAIIYNTITGTIGNPGTTVEIAQKYQVTNATNLYMDTVFAYFGESRVGARYRAKVYNNTGTGGAPGTLLATGNTYTVTAADTVGGAVGLIGFTFTAPLNVSLLGNGTYFVSIEQMDTFNYRLANNNTGVITANANYYNINGGAWSAVSTIGLNTAFLIWPRVYTNVTCNLAVSATVTSSTCELSNGGVTTTVTGNTGTTTYLWSNNATTANLSNVAAGTYTVTVTNGSCTATATATVTNTGTVPTFTMSNSAATCNNANGTATVNGAPVGSTYHWSNNATTASITGLTPGNYAVTVTNNGCTATNSTDVISTGAFTPQVSATNTTCGQNNGSATVSSPTGGTYNWSNGLSGATISNLAAGTYTVTVSSGGCTATASVTVNSSTGVTATASATNSTCSGATGTASVTASPSGTYSYLWSNGATTQNLSGLAAGTYSVTVTAGSCSATATATVSNAGAPTITVSGTNPSCFGQATGSASVSVSPAGSYNYSWNNGGTTNAITNLAAGTYTVTVRDASNCQAIGSYTVVAPSQINANASSTGVSCFGAANGSAVANATGGTGTLTYLWSNGATTNSLSNVLAGNYSVTVKDANNCSVTASTTVSTPAQINTSISSTGVSCFSAANGTATVTASGGTGALAYSWNSTPTQTTATATGLAAGSYSVTVTDANSCTTTATTTVSQPTSLSVSTTATGSSATATAIGGTSPYSYLWSSTPAQTTATATGLAAGSYTVTVTDAHACNATSTVVITGIENTNPNISTINIYPNPSNGSFKVDVQLISAENVSFEIRDLTGRKIFTSTEENTAAIVKDINLGNIAVGAYILSVSSKSGNANYRVVIK